ncbi:MAG TPA: DinB family protein [Ktedonobacterales bacterium]|nr:DinB family protein [Ktedonobacterales bacterium]
MDPLWRTILCKQFGAAIDMLDNALAACPNALWRQPVWHNSSDSTWLTEFWRVAYHAIYWLDLYLDGSEEGFAPPASFILVEDDAAGAPPAQPLSREVVRAYLTYARQKCRTTIETMTDERARQPVSFDWMKESEVVSFAELQLYCMRHIQEHTAQLSLLLGEHGVPAEQLDWVTRAD